MSGINPCPQCQISELEIKELAPDLGLPVQTSKLQDWSYEQQRTLLNHLIFKHKYRIQQTSRHSLSVLAQASEFYLRTHGIQQMENYLMDNFGSFISEEFALWKSALEPVPESSDADIQVVSKPISRRKVLWKHLLNLLIIGDPSVEWVDRSSGLFRFVQSEAAAETWGKVKRREKMDFEKMTHSIRTYYPRRKNIMYKGGQDLEYGFNLDSRTVRAYMDSTSCCGPQFQR